MDSYQKMIAISRYAKWLEEEKRRETWGETVSRYFDFLADELKSQHDYEIPQAERTELEKAVVDLEVLPSMRGLVSAGPSGKRCNLGIFNCAFTNVDSPRAFDEAMYVLMSGTGLGFSVERQHINQLPKVNEHFENSDTVIVVEDSKSGWAKALKELVSLLISGQVPKWDLSKVRKAGSRLKTSGGRASGPEAWISVAEYFVKVFKKAAGRKLTSLECHDLMCKIGGVVVTGGQRRAATISLSNLSDDRMREAKSGQWWLDNPQRSMANNSAVYTEKPELLSFMKEWQSLYQSKSGERGIFNREAANKQVEKTERRESYPYFGANPCQPGTARLLTPKGIRELSDLNVGDLIWSEDGWVTIEKKWSTGVKPVYHYGTSAGYFEGTENHRIIERGIKTEVKDATEIDSLVGSEFNFPIKLDEEMIMDGLVVGDGTVHKASNNLVLLEIGKDDQDYFNSEVKNLIINKSGAGNCAYRIKTGIKPEELDYTYNRRIPDRYLKAIKQKQLAFLRGLYSANGSICGGRITLKTSSYQLMRDVQLMLNQSAIHSYYTTNKSKEVEFANGKYICKESYDLNITRIEDKLKFQKYIGFMQEYKNKKLAETLEGKNIPTKSRVKNTYEINEITYLRDDEVFDITVSGSSHTYWTGGINASNCGEILLRSNELCNLSSVIVRESDSMEDLYRKVRLATILGTYQSALTNFKYLRKIWKNNCDEERLLGVSLSGILSKWKTPEDITRDLVHLKNIALSTNLQYANLVGIPQSKAITCVKPDGNTSQLVNGPSGIHAEWSEYYIRTVRGSNKDPLTKLMIAEGIPNEPDLAAPNDAVVFSFPRKAPAGSMLRKDLTAIQHLEIWKAVQENWCEHNPSITVNIRENEWLEVADWVWKNFDKICGVSFLPYDDHTYQQAPYQEITKEKYEELIAQMPEINFERLAEFEQEDQTTGQQQYACTGDVCSLVEI